MNGRFILFLVVGLLAGFAIGFLTANSMNRSQYNELLTENARLQSQTPETPGSQPAAELSDNEIRAKIDEAAANPKDFAFQKGLGLALYQYAAKKQDADLLAEVVTLLERAHSLNPDDYQLIVSLGNVHFDLGQMNKDDTRNLRARELYEKALAKNPKDINVITDLGLTYFLNENPDRKRAISELESALDQDPKYERALQYMTQAQIESKNNEAASRYLTRLKEVSPANPGIKDLEKNISLLNN